MKEDKTHGTRVKKDAPLDSEHAVPKKSKQLSQKKVSSELENISRTTKQSKKNQKKSGLEQENRVAAAVSKTVEVKKNGRSAAQQRVEALSDVICREIACEGVATSGDYCRLHYIKNWKKIKRKELILKEKKLNQYIEELVVKYPDKYIEAIRQDLASDKDFAKVIYDLDLDEGVEDFDLDGSDSVDSLIDTIKRDFDDDGETY